MGAWIETIVALNDSVQKLVAPLVGAWIETWVSENLNNLHRSHPSWVRGLKPERKRGISRLKSRTPRGCVD
mgnify:CR=1 FL=1